MAKTSAAQNNINSFRNYIIRFLKYPKKCLSLAAKSTVYSENLLTYICIKYKKRKTHKKKKKDRPFENGRTSLWVEQYLNSANGFNGIN
jgi:hypothetical protein